VNNSGNSFSQSASMAKVVKMLRIARLMRILRMVRFLAPIRIMATMIVGSMVSLLWLFILIFAVMYVFAIVLTQGATDSLRPANNSPLSSNRAGKIKGSFGDVPVSMYTLFMSMTGGVSWGEPGKAAEDLGWVYFCIFLFFMFFTTFSVLNIVTGVFVDGAIQHANSDRSLQAQKALEIKEQYAQALMELLDEIDTDGSGFISREEWDEAIKDDHIVALMEGLQIDARSTETLFQVLDTQNTSYVEIREFVDGMMRLKGMAKGIDIHVVLSNVKTLNAKASATLRLLETLIKTDS